MIKYKRNRDNIASKIQDEIVMVNVKHGNYYTLNPVATSIWELLETPRSRDEICDQLLEEYDIDRETCMLEVDNFLSELNEMKLIDEIKE
jgi:hypothetical protein